MSRATHTQSILRTHPVHHLLSDYPRPPSALFIVRPHRPRLSGITTRLTSTWYLDYQYVLDLLLFQTLNVILQSPEKTQLAPLTGVSGWAAMERTVRNYDEERIRDCKDDIDTLLVFVSLPIL